MLENTMLKSLISIQKFFVHRRLGDWAPWPSLSMPLHTFDNKSTVSPSFWQSRTSWTCSTLVTKSNASNVSNSTLSPVCTDWRKKRKFMVCRGNKWQKFIIFSSIHLAEILTGFLIIESNVCYQSCISTILRPVQHLVAHPARSLASATPPYSSHNNNHWGCFHHCVIIVSHLCHKVVMTPNGIIHCHHVTH